MKIIKKFSELFENSSDGKSNEEIYDICSRYGINEYQIRPDGSIDVPLSGASIINSDISRLPINFNYVDAYFNCYKNKLTTLVGSPRIVGGAFHCYSNKLISLVGSPDSVGGDFNCHFNPLTSLEGIPKKIGGRFNFDGIRIRGEMLNDEGILEYIYVNDVNLKNEEIPLLLTIISDHALDTYMKKNPIDLHYLDAFQDRKTGVLGRTGIKDMSKLGKLSKSGLI